MHGGGASRDFYWAISVRQSLTAQHCGEAAASYGTTKGSDRLPLITDN
jgi:hypothetical protein